MVHKITFLLGLNFFHFLMGFDLRCKGTTNFLNLQEKNAYLGRYFRYLRYFRSLRSVLNIKNEKSS